MDPGYSIIPPSNPPVPIAWALIFQKKLMSSAMINATQAPSNREMNQNSIILYI